MEDRARNREGWCRCDGILPIAPEYSPASLLVSKGDLPLQPGGPDINLGVRSLCLLSDGLSPPGEYCLNILSKPQAHLLCPDSQPVFSLTFSFLCPFPFPLQKERVKISGHSINISWRNRWINKQMKFFTFLEESWAWLSSALMDKYLHFWETMWNDPIKSSLHFYLYLSCISTLHKQEVISVFQSLNFFYYP